MSLWEARLAEASRAKRGGKGQALPLVSRLADGKLKRWEQRCALERWPLQISFASASTQDSLTRNPPLSKSAQHSSLEDLSPRMKVHFQMRAFGLETLTKAEMWIKLTKCKSRAGS